MKDASVVPIKSALSCLSYGVYVVSARSGDRVNAMTVRMATQVSMRPPCIALSLRARSLTCEFVLESGAFAVNVLAHGQELLGGHFGLRSGRNADKFSALPYGTGLTGAPLLCDCAAILECRVAATHKVGQSILVIGEIIHAETFNRTPLVYRESDYY